MSSDSKPKQPQAVEPETVTEQAMATTSTSPGPNPFEKTPTNVTSVPSSSSSPVVVTSDPDPESEAGPPAYDLAVPEASSMPSQISHHDPSPSSVPTYTLSSPSEDPLISLTLLKKRAQESGIPLPITKSSPPNSASYSSLADQIISSFFRAIASQNDELTSLFISTGLVSPDCPNARGETPLVVAVSTGHGGIVCTLLNHGADVNQLSRFESEWRLSSLLGPKPLGYTYDWQDETEFQVSRVMHEDREFSSSRLPLRTPLMVAALLGNLALVKLLVNDFKADDAIIAPDGQLALRLAADHGHREIVQFLPSRRGGAFRRWKVANEKSVRRIQKAGRKIYHFGKFFVWDIPRFFLWSCPRHLVFLPLKKAFIWAWEHKGRFPGWCKRQVEELPGRVKRGVEKLGRGVKAVGRGIKEIPGFVWRVMKWIWRVVCAIPGFMKIIGVWVWKCLKHIGLAVGDVFLRVVSAIHTAVMAVLGFFRRITLKDVWNGFVTVLKALFVDLPGAIWHGVKSFGKVSYEALKKLFGWVGELLWYLCLGLFWFVVFVPKQLWKMVTAIGGSIAKGYHEIMVWFNPKH